MRNKLSLLILSILISLTILPSLVAAQNSDPLLTGQGQTNLIQQDTAFINQIGLNPNISPGQTVSRIVKLLLSFLGVIFICLIIYAGFTWMLSAGNETRIETSKKIMSAAVIGLAIVLSAYAITYFVLDNLLWATKGTNMSY